MPSNKTAQRTNGSSAVASTTTSDPVPAENVASPAAEEAQEAAPDSAETGAGDASGDAAVFVADETETDPPSATGAGSTLHWSHRACKEVVRSAVPSQREASLDLVAQRSVAGPGKTPTVFTNEKNLWEGTPQFIAYYFMEGDDVQKRKVIETIDEWTWYANVVFLETDLLEKSTVRIRFDAEDGNWSYVGRQCVNIRKTEATMNLGSVDALSPNTNGFERGVILHEFGHTLGLLHEHQSPAHGGQAVENVAQALQFYKNDQGWSEKQIYQQVINVYNSHDVSNYSQVDVNSIMHYPQPKELTGLDHDIPYNEKLSDLDKAYMILQYPRKTMHPKAEAEGWSIKRALEVIDAPADVVEAIGRYADLNRDSYGEISPVNMRTVLKKWCREKYGVVEQPSRAPIQTTPLRAPTANEKKPEESFVYQLYDKLSTMFCPGGGQYFSLQFPTRFLDQQTFSYELDGYLSRFNKPVAVNEAEFALTDALYPIAPIVGGTNGQSLSRNYSKALNSLIPTFESTAVRKQRERMRQWLLKETKAGNAAYTMDTRLAIPGLSAESAKELSAATGVTITPGPLTEPLADQKAAKDMAMQAIKVVQGQAKDAPRGMTRMEFSEALMQAYLNDRQDWETRKDQMIRDAEKEMATDPKAMDRLTRSLAHISALEEAKLAAKHGDAVVRGYSHTVRGFLGHLDIKSVAESLQDAKDSLRESALSSLYTASSVYPVAMMPTDWFEALDTGFTREELAQDKDLIEAAIRAKAQLIDNLDNQIANLRGFNKGDPEVAKKAMKEAAARRETAIAELSKKYTASTISAVKLALIAASGPAAVGAGAATQAVATILAKPKEDKDKDSVLALIGGEEGLKDIGKQIDDVAAANLAVNSASRALTEHMSEYSLAVAGDTQTMVQGLQRQLTNAKRELDELQESYTIAQRTSSKPAGELKDVGKLPSGNGGSRWSEVHIQSSVSDDYTRTESKSSASVKDFQCNFWIGSHSDSSSQSSASSSAQSGSNTLNVDVSMRVTYVTVDRAGWFDPSLLAMSKSFMRGSDDENYTPWATWKDGIKAEAVAEAIKQGGTDKPEGYLAAFPVGYILVKDCVIKVTQSGTKGESLKEHIDTKAQGSGGFLCFSHSSASSSSTDGSASSTTTASGGVVVRIPGPQILGYMMQVVDKDESLPFKQLMSDEMFLDDLEEMDKQDKDKRDKPQPPRTVVPGLGLGHQPQRTIRRYDDDGSSRSSSSNDQSSGGSTAEKPAHSILPPKPAEPVGSGSGLGHLADALQLALNGREFKDWASTQPDDVRNEILKKLTEALGKSL